MKILTINFRKRLFFLLWLLLCIHSWIQGQVTYYSTPEFEHKTNITLSSNDNLISFKDIEEDLASTDSDDPINGFMLKFRFPNNAAAKVELIEFMYDTESILKIEAYRGTLIIARKVKILDIDKSITVTYTL